MENKNEKNSIRPNDGNRRQLVLKKAREYKMLAWIFGSIAALIVILGGVTFYYFQRNSNLEIAVLEDNNTELNAIMAEQDSLLNDWMLSMLEIEEDLHTLQGKEASLISKSNSMELTMDIRESILDEIQNINGLLDENKQKISRLNARLQKSGITINALNEKVKSLETQLSMRENSLEELKNQLAEKDFKIAELNTTVSSLNKEVVKYSEEIQKYEDSVLLQTAVLNRAFIAKGQSDELEEKGLITEIGGFLGLGKSKTVQADLNDEMFEQIAINETKRIELNAKKVKLISEHPSTSYDMIETDSTIAYLEIKNPSEFWKITRYAVLETKN